MYPLTPFQSVHWQQIDLDLRGNMVGCKDFPPKTPNQYFVNICQHLQLAQLSTQSSYNSKTWLNRFVLTSSIAFFHQDSSLRYLVLRKTLTNSEMKPRAALLKSTRNHKYAIGQLPEVCRSKIPSLYASSPGKRVDTRRPRILRCFVGCGVIAQLITTIELSQKLLPLKVSTQQKGRLKDYA